LTGHEILPDAGACVRGRDGDPADLLHPEDYPIISVCCRCGRPVRCERWLMGAWRHL
jgi:hypothetical protein